MSAETLPPIGTRVFFEVSGLIVELKVVDHKRSYGRRRLQLEAIAVRGETCLEATSVQTAQADARKDH